MHLDQKVSLKTLHTFGMEVEARYFVEAKTHSEVLTLLNYRNMIHMPVLFMGEGSNILFTRDFTGIVIRISSKGITLKEEDDEHILVTAEAGENWDQFVRYCVGHGWAGLENLSLIPGTVGAAPIQNIGAYGVEVKDLIESVRFAEIDSGKQHRLTSAECRFGYRDSIFKQELKGKVIVLNVTFKLIKVSGQGSDKVTELQGDRETGFQGDRVTGLQGDKVTRAYIPRLDYGDIRGELQRLGVTVPGIHDVREAVCNIRRRKLPDPAVIGNAGSFFKNPVIGRDLLESLQDRFPEMPIYPLSRGQSPRHGKISGSDNPGFRGEPTHFDNFKVPAAWLIEQCGWKGFREGDAGVHVTQPLVLVNYGNATGRQVVDLANRVMDSVHQKFGIRLETEVNII